MKRYLPIVGVIIFVLALLGLSNFIWQQQEKSKAENIRETERHLVVYSDMPTDVNTDLAAYFKDRTGLHVQITTMTDEEIQKALEKTAADRVRPDVVIATQPVLQKESAAGIFRPVISKTTENVPMIFKQSEGYWNGLLIDPIVFVVNDTYFNRHGSELSTWESLLSDPNIRLAFPDLAATDMAGDFLCSFIETHGQEKTAAYLKEIQRHVPIYSKNMGPIVRRVAAGDVDAGVADVITARQYMQEQMPIRILYPQDGTSYWLVGEAVTTWCTDDELAGAFIDWLYSDDVPVILRNKHMHVGFVSESHPKELDSQGNQLVLFPVQKDYTVQGRKELQDWWIKTVRFGKES